MTLPEDATWVAAEQLEPVVDDLSIFVMAGRTKDPAPALQQGVDAERHGFRGMWLSERYDLKDAGAMLGGIAARTTRLQVGTAALACASRHPLLTASLAATMHAMYGGRFILGLGRSSESYLMGQGIRTFSYEAFTDYVDILRRLFNGETVSYDGPAGRYESIKTVDTIPDRRPPEIWSVILGGPRACKTAARTCDGVMLTPFLTPEAVHRAVTTIREERDKLGLDPKGIRICHPIVSTPDMDETDTRLLAHCRAVTYLVGAPDFARAYQRLNNWDERIIVEQLPGHALFAGLRGSADQVFHRADLLDAAGLIPDSWMQETCALGSAGDCVKQLRNFRDAGADELALYGSTPSDNARLIAAWRDSQGV